MRKWMLNKIKLFVDNHESLNENQSLLTFVQNGAKKQTGRRGDAAQQGWQASSYYEYPAFSMATSEMV